MKLPTNLQDFYNLWFTFHILSVCVQTISPIQKLICSWFREWRRKRKGHQQKLLENCIRKLHLGQVHWATAEKPKMSSKWSELCVFRYILSLYLHLDENHKESGGLSNSHSQTFVLLSEECGHEYDRDGPDPQAIGGCCQHQTRQSQTGDHWVVETEWQAHHGQSTQQQEDDVDSSAVQVAGLYKDWGE